MSLKWSAGSGASSYSVTRDGVELAVVSSPSYQDNGTKASTSYSYKVAAVNAAGGTNGVSDVVSTLTPPDGYGLTFDDEFTGAAIDRSRWLPAWPWGTGLNDTYASDESLPQNITLSGGIAHFLVNRATSPTGLPFTTAVASTSGTFAQQGGYWEARLRMPAGPAIGLWPAFWLVSTDGTWPPEIDIMEWLGITPNALDMTVHYGANNLSDEGWYIGPDFSADYHVIGLLWTSTRLEWYVDGVRRFATSAGIPTKQMQIILNNSTGGWNGNAVADFTKFPASLDVDYVRVYQAGAGGTVTVPTSPSTPTSPPASADTAAPSTPSNLLARSNAGSVRLSWRASTDNVGVSGYNVYRDGTQIGTATGTSYSDVSPVASATYTVAAFDAAGNVSTQSASASVTRRRRY